MSACRFHSTISVPFSLCSQRAFFANESARAVSTDQSECLFSADRSACWGKPTWWGGSTPTSTQPCATAEPSSGRSTRSEYRPKRFILFHATVVKDREQDPSRGGALFSEVSSHTRSSILLTRTVTSKNACSPNPTKILCDSVKVLPTEL